VVPTLAESHLAIQNLIATYAERLDARDYEGVGALFEHGRVTGSGMERPVEGSEAVAKMFESFGAGRGGRGPVRHLTTNVRIEVADDGLTATSRSYFLVVGYDSSPVIRFFGSYADEFACVDGSWRFARRHLAPALPSGDPES